MAQQASPKVSGQIEYLRAQSIKKSTPVKSSSPPMTLWRMAGSLSRTRLLMVLFPLEGALPPGVGERHQQNHNKKHHLGETDPAQLFELNGPGKKEGGLHIKYHKDK